MRVLTEPKNSLVRQYESLFQMANSELAFTDDALQTIAKRALSKSTGARALRSVIEEVMMDIMFELPDQDQGSKYVVNADVVEGRKRLFNMSPPKTKSA